MPRGVVQNFGNSLSFNGTSSTVTNSAFTLSSTNFNIAFWLKRSSPGTFQSNQVYFYFPGNSGYVASIKADGGNTANVYFYVTNSGTATYGMNFGKVYDTRWHHYVVTAAANNVKTYLDGVVVNTQSSVTLPPLNAGVTVSQSSGYAQCILANIVIANGSPWTASQVANLYTQGVIPGGALSSIIWPFNEGSGTTAHDISGGGYNSSITSGTWSTDVPSAPRQTTNSRSSTTPRVNLITNPSFETSGFWSSSGGAGTTTGLTNSLNDTTYALFGTHACREESNDGTGQFYLTNSSPFTPSISVEYTFSAYVYIPTGSPIADIGIGIRDWSTYNYIIRPNGGTGEVFTNLTAGQWTRISYSAVGGALPSGSGTGTQWRLTVADPGGITAGTPESYWIDGTLLETSSFLGSYFDGNTNGGSWTGTANQSTSTLAGQAMQRQMAGARSLAT